MLQNKLIWLFIDSKTFGGIESHVLSLAKAINCNGNKVEVIFYRSYGDHPLIKHLNTENISYKVLEGKIIEFYGLLKDNQPDLLHTHGYKSGIIGRLIAKMLNIPVVSTYHAGEPGVGRIKLYNKIDFILAKYANCIAVSDQIKRKLPKDTVVINNFVDIDNLTIFNRYKKRPFTLAFVGRLSYEKGPDIYCQLAIINKNLKFEIYGDGPMRRSLNINSSNISYKGLVESMDNYWENIDLLCITSRHEGMPMVALEAMSRGIPIVAFNVGDLSKLIVDPNYGSLIEPGNIIDLNLAIRRWAKISKPVREYHALQIQKHIKINFSVNAVLPKIYSVYEKAIDRKTNLLSH